MTQLKQAVEVSGVWMHRAHKAEHDLSVAHQQNTILFERADKVTTALSEAIVARNRAIERGDELDELRADAMSRCDEALRLIAYWKGETTREQKRAETAEENARLTYTDGADTIRELVDSTLDLTLATECIVNLMDELERVQDMAWREHRSGNLLDVFLRQSDKDFDEMTDIATALHYQYLHTSWPAIVVPEPPARQDLSPYGKALVRYQQALKAEREAIGADALAVARVELVDARRAMQEEAKRI